MPKINRVIDIFPPKKTREYYHLPAEPEIKRNGLAPKLEKDKDKNKRGRFGKILFFVFLFLFGGAIFLHFVLAKVSIEIWPESENLEFNEQVIINVNSRQLDPALKIVPGEVFETEKSISQQFNSTGEATQEKNAEGIIRVYNNYHLPQTLVQNTRFQPALDKVIYFRSLKTSVIPAKGYLDVNVKADRSGEDYNIAPATFSVPGLAGLPQYYSVYGKSSSEMTGGFKGLVNQVRKEDLESAEESLSERLKKETKDYFLSQSVSAEEFIFLDEGMIQEIIEATSSEPAGETADTFNFTLKTKTRAVAFKKNNLDNLIKELILLKIKENNKKTDDGSLKINYSVSQADFESGKIILDLKVSVKIYSDVSQESVRKALAGKSIKESQTLMENQPSVVKVKISAFPFWLNKIPDDKEKIKMKLNIGP